MPIGVVWTRGRSRSGSGAFSIRERIAASARVAGLLSRRLLCAGSARPRGALIWDRRSEGVAMRAVARELGRAHGSVRTMVEDHGGVRPRSRIRSTRHLSFGEREEISRWMAAGESLRSIAARLGRSASTVSREVPRNGYRAQLCDLIQELVPIAIFPMGVVLIRCLGLRSTAA